MPLTREERKLLHQKSKQPTFGINKPDPLEGNEGDVSYRRIEGSGTVQYLKQGGEWIAMSSSGDMPPSRNIIKSSSSGLGSSGQHGLLTGLGSDSHTQYLLISGTRAMTGNLNMGTNDIGSVGALDVDGATTLDKTTIDTTDGAFSVSGANLISLITTGSNDINLTSAQTLDVDVGVDYELNVARTCDWNTAATDWDNSGTFNLTSVDNLTIQTSGADTTKTILILNGNNNASAFRGIHLKTDSGNVGSSQNSIFLECDNRSSKGGGDGIDIRSEDGILIRAEDPNTGTASNIQMRATRHIDLQGGTASISPTGDAITRVKVHGITEIMQLYRPSGSSITTNLETITSPFGVSNTETGHTEFEAINTQHLLRAITYKATSSSVTNGSYVSIVNGDNDDNQMGTVWRVTIFYKLASGSSSGYFQIWHCYASLSDSLSVVSDINVSVSGSDTSTVTWESGAATESDPKGIKWTNGTGSTVLTFRASALKIHGASDF